MKHGAQASKVVRPASSAQALEHWWALAAEMAASGLELGTVHEPMVAEAAAALAELDAITAERDFVDDVLGRRTGRCVPRDTEAQMSLELAPTPLRFSGAVPPVELRLLRKIRALDRAAARTLARVDQLRADLGLRPEPAAASRP